MLNEKSLEAAALAALLVVLVLRFVAPVRSFALGE